MNKSKSLATHTDAFTGVSFVISQAPTLSVVDAANDSDDMAFQAPTSRGLSDMLASLDVLTSANWAAFAAIMSA